MSRTTIAPEKTAAEIQELLSRRAKRVMTEYDGGEVVAISFSIMFRDKEILFRLPVRWQNYFKVLQQAKRKRGSPKIDQEQARRTAWRIAKMGLEADLVRVDAQLVELPEIMLPYVVQGKDQETLYERLAKKGFLLEHN